MNTSPKVQTNSLGYPDDLNGYRKIRVVGKGTFGLVFEAIVLKGKHSGEHICIKQVNLDKLDNKNLSYLSVS